MGSNHDDSKYKFYIEVGVRIRNMRAQQKVSQDDLASALGISRVSMTNIENGKQLLPAYLIAKIAWLLKRKVSDLIPDYTEEIAEQAPKPKG